LQSVHETLAKTDILHEADVRYCVVAAGSISRERGLRVHSGVVRLAFLDLKCRLCMPCCTLDILRRCDRSRMTITPTGIAMTTSITYPMYSAPSASTTSVAARTRSSSAASTNAALQYNKSPAVARASRPYCLRQKARKCERSFLLIYLTSNTAYTVFANFDIT